MAASLTQKLESHPGFSMKPLVFGDNRLLILDCLSVGIPVRSKPLELFSHAAPVLEDSLNAPRVLGILFSIQQEAALYSGRDSDQFADRFNGVIVPTHEGEKTECLCPRHGRPLEPRGRKKIFGRLDIARSRH
jgi:hypothetical protein